MHHLFQVINLESYAECSIHVNKGKLNSKCGHTVVLVIVICLIHCSLGFFSQFTINPF
jgi:hypothetical protein